MKLLWCGGLVWALVLGFAQAASAKLERVQLFGTAYVRLEDWAESLRLETKWIVPRQRVIAKNGAHSLEFTVDSRKLNFNGVNVWLSAPVAFSRGAAHVGYTDLNTALQPVLSPAKNLKSRPVRTICLDPGHGGKDSGNRDGKQQEKSYTLLLAKELSAELVKKGFKVVLTRDRDITMDLPARPALARKRNADLFISLHFNASAGRGASPASGVEVYCMTPAYTSSTNAGGEGAENGAFPGNRNDKKNMLLAYCVQKTLVKQLKVEDRGVRRGRFAVLRTATMPAVLIEGGFLSNPAEARKIHNREYRQKLAETIAEGILAYKKAVE